MFGPISKRDQAYYARLEREHKAKEAQRKQYEEGGEKAYRMWCVAKMRSGISQDEFTAIQRDIIRRKRTGDWTIPDPDHGGSAAIRAVE